MKPVFSIIAFLVYIATSAFSQSQPYFPPATGAWETLSPDSLDFCQERIDSLYNYLGERNTKGFLLLKDGRIVLEKYYGSFTQDSIWYWASAGKTVTTFLVGQAQEQGLLDINNPSSDYLGKGWTSCPPDKEDQITVWHQLTMTSGLNDNVPDDNCKEDTCLTYLADAGTRWSYHNAPYLLLQDVVANASGMTYNQFTNINLRQPTGMFGVWINGVFYGKPRDMARFGILMQANGIWNGDTLLADQDYLYDATHPSQNLNESYGYLWWLNGQDSYMIPGFQFVFPGKLVPNAPDDMVAGLGKNDQKLHLVRSKGWVVVRMGDAANAGPGGSNVPISLDNVMWDYINQLECNTVATTEPSKELRIEVWPNPTQDFWNVKAEYPIQCVELYGMDGRLYQSMQHNEADYQVQVDASALPCGVYSLLVRSAIGMVRLRVLRM